EFPALLAHFKTSVAGVTIIDFFHFFDRIKEADDEGGAKGFSGSDRSAAEFLDQANITALVTPSLIDHRRVERHSREPRTFASGFRIAEVISTKKPFGHRINAAPIIGFLVRREVFEELARGNLARVAEVNLAESVALFVLDVSRHVEAEEHGVARIRAGDLVAGDEVALASGKHKHLAPFRTGLLSGRRDLVAEAARDRNEIFTVHDARRKR